MELLFIDDNFADNYADNNRQYCLAYRQYFYNKILISALKILFEQYIIGNKYNKILNINKFNCILG